MPCADNGNIRIDPVLTGMIAANAVESYFPRVREESERALVNSAESNSFVAKQIAEVVEGKCNDGWRADPQRAKAGAQLLERIRWVSSPKFG